MMMQKIYQFEQTMIWINSNLWIIYFKQRKTVSMKLCKSLQTVYSPFKYFNQMVISGMCGVKSRKWRIKKLFLVFETRYAHWSLMIMLFVRNMTRKYEKYQTQSKKFLIDTDLKSVAKWPGEMKIQEVVCPVASGAGPGNDQQKESRPRRIRRREKLAWAFNWRFRFNLIRANYWACVSK